MKAALVAIFWLMQVGANLAFKYGSTQPQRWWWGFTAGNILGIGSIFFMMKLYERINVNIALTIAGGGTFLLVQIVLAGVFKSKLTFIQWSGILLVALGMLVAGLGASQQPA